MANARTFFGRMTRGSAATLNVEELANVGNPDTCYLIHLRWDHRQCLDSGFREAVRARVQKWAQVGFGATATVRLRSVVVEAGDAENGKPSAQLIVMPPCLPSDVELWGEPHG